MGKQFELKFDYDALGELCLRSSGIADALMAEANKMRSRYGKKTKCRLRKQYGKRFRVYIDTPYDEASKDNKMAKAVK